MIDPTPFRLWCNGSPALWGEGAPMQGTDWVRQLCDHVQEEGGQKPGRLGRVDTVSAGKGEINVLLLHDEWFFESCTHGRRGRDQSNCRHGCYLAYYVELTVLNRSWYLVLWLVVFSWWNHGDIIVNGVVVVVVLWTLISYSLDYCVAARWVSRSSGPGFQEGSSRVPHQPCLQLLPLHTSKCTFPPHSLSNTPAHLPFLPSTSFSRIYFAHLIH